jgi:hypothetical protein
MQKFLFITLAISTLVFSSCSSDDDKMNRTDLQQLIVEALSGDSQANLKLQGLVGDKHIGNTDFNNLLINSLTVNDKTYFSVLLEYFDPTLNLFAIYDDELNFYLLDKSLNGYLSSEWNEIDNRKFIFVQERFLTKDVLSLDRFSIYEVFDNSASLVYRSLSRFVKENSTSFQTVGSITQDFILSKITDVNDKALNNQVDTFYYNSDSKKYLSKFNLFNNYVKKEINEFVWVNIKPEIPMGFLESENGSIGQ